MQLADLHTHSYFSDGRLSPTELLASAKQAGVTMLALTDHDTLAGLPEAEQAAITQGIQLISGIEVSSQWVKPRSGRITKTGYVTSIHIVGLNIQNLTDLQFKMNVQQQARGTRALAIAEKLEKHLKQNPIADILPSVDNCVNAITRTHFANWLMEKEFISKHQQAFDKWLGEGKLAHVPLVWMSIAEAIDAIKQSGGIAVLAHPARYNMSATALRALVAEFVALGGQAIELPDQNEPSGTRDMIERMIRQYGLLVSTASDFHGTDMPWRRLGKVPTIKDGFTPVWQAFV